MILLPYRIPPGDQYFPVWARERVNASGAAIAISPSWQNTQQYPFLLLHAGGVLTPGAGQSALQGSVHLQDPDASLSTVVFASGFVVATAAQIVRFGGMVHLLVPPRWRVTGRGDFSAGGVSNTASIDVFGYYIPRGNISTP